MKAEAETGLRFRVQYSDGRVETLLIDAQRALIGSAPYCEVRLPLECAAREHVEVIAHGGIVQLSARSHDPPATLGDVVLTSSIWSPESPLHLGGATLFVELVDLTAKARRTFPLWLLLLLPLLAALCAVAYAARPASVETRIPEAPPLLDPPVALCPAVAPDQLEAFAEERLRSAMSKRERRPFAPREGVDAVPILEVAARCFALAGDDDGAREAMASATSLRERLDEEYKIRRVRLEHAYRTRDVGAAKRELAVLIPMIGDQHGAYADWLSMLDRYADLELEQRSTTRLSP